VLTTRLVKTSMVALTAAFAALVTFDNVVDYGSNYAFVRHTLSMDTTFPGNALRGRAIDDPVIWTAAYWAIIAAEGLVAVVLGLGAVRLFVARRARAHAFNAAKRLVVMGVGLGFLLWFGGFMIVAGEWFAMWQSKSWNGQEAAFRFYMTLLAMLIFVNQPDGELDS
jgi:predicted small integral membrane protein